MPLKDPVARRQYDAAYKMRNRSKRIAHDKRRVEWYKRWMGLLRESTGCIECGESSRLVHHHIDPDTKRQDVACMSGCSMGTWMKEIDKCVVLCSSCHAIEHKREDNFLRYEE